MSSSQLAIVQTYKVQTNGNSTASKAKKHSHGSHSISVYCNNTSANYCNIFAYLRITYNTSGACLNLPEFTVSAETLIYSEFQHSMLYGFRVRARRNMNFFNLPLVTKSIITLSEINFMTYNLHH